ncbi:MAG: WD40/YVTN/BNR-like repeat-containing protein [Candidatus Planktophila sp.]
MNHDDTYFDDPMHDDDAAPRSKKSKPLFVVALLAVAGFLIQNTLAANISISSGAVLEFGQGIQVLTPCSGSQSITMTPGSTFVNVTNAGNHKFGSLTVSNIPSSCYGDYFTISAYDTSTNSALPLYGSSATSFTVHDWNGTFYSPSSQAGLSVVTNSTSSFTATFATPITASTSVYRLTIQSGKSQITLTCVIVGSTCTFTSRAASSNYTAAAASDDLSVLYAGQDGAQIVKSSNGGVTWSTLSTTAYAHWYGLDTSSDGSKVVASELVSGNVWTSSDAGATWTARTGAGTRSWNSVAMSGSGSKIIAAADNAYLQISTDSGATWTAQTSAGQRNWAAVSMSSDGSKLVALTSGGANSVWTSADGGTTWTQRTNPAGPPSWRLVRSSGDGANVVASSYGGYVWVSNDYGVTWSSATSIGSTNWKAVDVSKDGSTMVAGVGWTASGLLYISTDSGATWRSVAGSPTKDWHSAHLDTTGSKLFVAAYSDYLFTTY